MRQCFPRQRESQRRPTIPSMQRQLNHVITGALCAVAIRRNGGEVLPGSGPLYNNLATAAKTLCPEVAEIEVALCPSGRFGRHGFPAQGAARLPFALRMMRRHEWCRKPKLHGWRLLQQRPLVLTAKSARVFSATGCGSTVERSVRDRGSLVQISQPDHEIGCWSLHSGFQWVIGFIRWPFIYFRYSAQLAI